MADSEGSSPEGLRSVRSIGFRTVPQVSLSARVSRAHRVFAFEADKRAIALAAIVRGEIARIKHAVMARLDLLTAPPLATQLEVVEAEDGRRKLQITSLEMRISRESGLLVDIIQQIPDRELQFKLTEKLMTGIEDVPLVK